MNYQLLNKIQRDKMNSITNNNYKMKWENPAFMDILMGGLPKVRHFQHDSEISGEIYSLEKLLASYDAFSSEKEEFLQKIKDHIDVIRGKKASWYGLNLYEIEECVHLHEFCLISGEGGIGKSYFIKCFEERLETKNIPHLCLYGKFEKDIYNLDIEEIINDCKSGFVFIVDAVNEMSEKGQEDLFQVLVDIKKHSKVRIVITYRNNAMDADILKQYREIASAEYAFPGVSFESALGEILKLSVPDVYKYEDILYSNNALLLSMLCNVLSSTKLTDETENGIASITFILEQYIKKSIGKIFKGSISCQGVDIWKDTKRIAQWMYEHEEKRIDEFNLLSIVKTGTDYLTTMIQLGFLGYYESESIRYFHFLIDSLTDFLVARSLFDDIRGKIFDEQVDIIKSKIRNLYNLEEAVIIAIFDNLSPNYEYIKKLLVSTGLMERLQYDTLVKIKFKKDSIQDFLTVFSPAKPDELLGVMGGYTDKPFNCTNYLRNYYFENECKQTELSVILSGHHFLGGIKGRLKNILYFITLNNRSDRRDDEAYYFAILCCSAPNKDVRCLAMKLLYEIVSSRTVFKKRLIEEYKIFTDFYIKEAIIFVLSKVKYNDVDIVKFFEKLIKEERNLSAKSIKRIAEYFGDEYGYIRWNRENLYDFKQDAIISDFMDDLLLTVDLMNKEFLPFRYWGKDHIDMHTKFLKNDKHIIGDINNYLEQKYQCVRTGDCNGSVAFERRIMAEISPKADIETLDMNSFFESYEVIIKKLFNHYQVTNKKTERHMREEDFHDSVYMKCVDIATGLYYGSLMCNYYTNQFATYNNNQRNIGYEVYDPLEYGEEVALTSPVPTYQDFVERLGEYIIKNIEVPDAKDLIWAKNVKLTRKNVLNLLKPLEIKHNEWVMLAGRISLHEDDKYETKWRDTYDIWCCTSPEETIIDDGNARYLTIELDEYSGSLRDYVNCTVRSWLCKDVKNISNQSDVFDETSLVLPPAELIRYFNLEVNVSDLSWNTSDGIKVVICNNNKNSYYKDPIGGTVFIRKDYLDKYLESHTLKYFAFTERFIPETGYADETALHFEIQDGNIIVEILNNGKKRDWQSIVNPSCEECPYGVFEQNNRERNDWQNTLNEILELYGIDEENMPLF